MLRLAYLTMNTNNVNRGGGHSLRCGVSACRLARTSLFNSSHLFLNRANQLVYRPYELHSFLTALPLYMPTTRPSLASGEVWDTCYRWLLSFDTCHEHVVLIYGVHCFADKVLKSGKYMSEGASSPPPPFPGGEY